MGTTLTPTLPGATAWAQRASRFPGQGEGEDFYPDQSFRSIARANQEVPTQPVSDTSTITPSGPPYLTSTLP
jgi:hypothetical protein